MSRVTLDQLLALNEEIAALVRAGIPLEEGLTALGREAPGQLGVLAARLADRMQAGESLTEILEQDTTTFPPVWRTVVLAGLRAGHLAAALESLSLTARRASELRRAMATALIYPAVVLTVAYLVFLFTMAYLIPVISRAYVDLTGTPNVVLAWVVSLSQTIPIWGVLIPVLCVTGLIVWWYRGGRAIRTFRSRGRGGRRLLFGSHRPPVIPTIGRSLRDGRMATFAELLRLMDQHQVPLPEAIILAADASGDRGLSQAARTIAQQLEQGKVFRSRDDLPAALPPLLGWSIVSGTGRRALDRALATSAEMYRQRALNAARWATAYLPIILTVVVGGGAVLTQAVIVFLPFVSLLYRLALPHYAGG